VTTHPLAALVLVVRRLLDAVGVVLEGGVTPGVVLLLLEEGGNGIGYATEQNRVGGGGYQERCLPGGGVSAVKRVRHPNLMPQHKTSWRSV